MVNINDNFGLGAVDATFTYTGNVGDTELTVAATLLVSTTTIDTVETVAYFDAGASNASASSMGNEVVTPWPISARWTPQMMRPSSPILSQALSVVDSGLVAPNFASASPSSRRRRA